MPYRKVGVTPQPTSQSGGSNAKGGRSSRKQGITMEDLKKQTALRLAQEQQHGQHGQHGQHSRLFPSTTQQQRKNGAKTSDHQAKQHLIQQKIYVQGSTEFQKSVDHQPRILIPARNHFSNEVTTYTQQPAEIIQAQIVYQQVPSSMVSGGNLRDTAVSNQGQGSNKSKLPHGLTVHELKEMTKARLQAEAAERHDQDFVRTSPRSSVSYKHNAGQQTFQQSAILDGVRDSPCDNSFTDRLQVVSKMSTSHGYSQQDRILQSVASSQEFPAPPGFQSPPSQGSLNSNSVHGRESWHQPPKDTWETGSLGSHKSPITINSDYVGRCDSPYGLIEPSDSPYARSRSFTTGTIDRHFENVITSTSNTSNAPYFDNSNSPGMNGNLNHNPNRNYNVNANSNPNFNNSNSTFNPNRRRASTSSPRQNISYLHEKKVSSFGADLGIPFDSEPMNSLSARRTPEPVLPDNNYGNVTGNVGMDNFSFNRPRTSSAPSVLPFVSNDMFGDRGSSPRSIPSNNHDLSNSLIESILGDSTNRAKQENKTDFSSVFRSSSQDGVNGAELNPWGGTRNGGAQSGSSFSGDSGLGLVKKFDSLLLSPDDFRRKVGSDISLFPTLSGDMNKTPSSQISGVYDDQGTIDRDQFGYRKKNPSRGI